MYNTTNVIATLRKHVNSDHSNILKKFEKKKNLLRENEKQPSKQTPNISSNSISNSFVAKEPFKKMMCSKNNFWKICRK